MKVKILSIILLLIPVVITAQQGGIKTTETNAIRVSYQSEAITVDNTSGGVGFTASKINPTCTGCVPSTSQASAASCTLETADIRIQTSGQTVNSTTGLYISSGSSITIYGYNDIAAFRAIRVGASSGVLNCTYFR